MMLRRRPLTESNSEVVTMYSGLFGRMRAISFCAASMRSGVGGCVEKTLGIVPGRRFSPPPTRPNHPTHPLAPHPPLHIHSKPTHPPPPPHPPPNSNHPTPTPPSTPPHNPH